MQFSGKTPLDGPNIFSSGGSHEQPVQVDPGSAFKMLLDLPATVLVGHRRLNEVQVIDSLGQVHTADWLQMILIRHALRKQRQKWRDRFGFRGYQKHSDEKAYVEEPSLPQSNTQQIVPDDITATASRDH